MLAAAQPRAGENTPPDYSALPQPGNIADPELAKRVADMDRDAPGCGLKPPHEAHSPLSFLTHEAEFVYIDQRLISSEVRCLQ